jgi:hypothetical protein
MGLAQDVADLGSTGQSLYFTIEADTDEGR